MTQQCSRFDVFVAYVSNAYVQCARLQKIKYALGPNYEFITYLFIHGCILDKEETDLHLMCISLIHSLIEQSSSGVYN